jgi:hypothetical protein
VEDFFSAPVFHSNSSDDKKMSGRMLPKASGGKKRGSVIIGCAHCRGSTLFGGQISPTVVSIHFSGALEPIQELSSRKAGLPDGLFSNQKFQFGPILEGLRL